MIQYEVYNTPSSNKEELGRFQCTDNKQRSHYLQPIKERFEYASSATPSDASKSCATENILYSRAKVRTTAASIFPRLEVSTRVRARCIQTDEIIG